LPKVSVALDGRGFVTEQGRRFAPFGVNYYRPHTGWAPQIWKKFDAEATRRDFALLREAGANCVRVFLTYGSFYQDLDRLDEDGLAKFEQFLALAEEAGLYVHPTGPDHWEGMPAWARGDRFAEDAMLDAISSFWRQFAARYRGRKVIFAYDLLNEPTVQWNSPAMREKWRRWVGKKYGSPEQAAAAWGRTLSEGQPVSLEPPPPKDAPGNRELLDYQHFRERVAEEWTRRQVAAIKESDPEALVTVGLIQWSAPVLLPGPQHYSGFRPAHLALLLDFLEVHFYPLEHGFYEYASQESTDRNLAYLESVVREVARPGRPVVVAEFGWYGGGKLTIDQGKHQPATEAQQAGWCRSLIETTAPLACGWLNWGFCDHPEARDCSQLSGLFTVDGTPKAWGREFQRLAKQYRSWRCRPVGLDAEFRLDWDACLVSQSAAAEFRQNYYQAFLQRQKPRKPSARTK
jgi:hypothetical protein